MFEEIPHVWWWVAAANLTDWFYWPAISAVLSFAALLKTIDIATRSDRERRAREISLVKAMLFCTGTGVGCLRVDARNVAAATDVQEMISRVKTASMLPQLAWAMEQLKIQDIPATEAIDTYVSAWHAMKYYQTDLDQFKDLTAEMASDLIGKRQSLLESYSESFAHLIVHLGGQPDPRDDVFVKHWIELAEAQCARGKINKFLRSLTPRWKSTPTVQDRVK